MFCSNCILMAINEVSDYILHDIRSKEKISLNYETFLEKFKCGSFSEALYISNPFIHSVFVSESNLILSFS